MYMILWRTLSVNTFCPDSKAPQPVSGKVLLCKTVLSLLFEVAVGCLPFFEVIVRHLECWCLNFITALNISCACVSQMSEQDNVRKWQKHDLFIDGL